MTVNNGRSIHLQTPVFLMYFFCVINSSARERLTLCAARMDDERSEEKNMKHCATLA